MARSTAKLRKLNHRRQFIAWLTMELKKRGANLPDETNYKTIRDEMQRLLFSEAA